MTACVLLTPCVDTKSSPTICETLGDSILVLYLDVVNTTSVKGTDALPDEGVGVTAGVRAGKGLGAAKALGNGCLWGGF